MRQELVTNEGLQIKQNRLAAVSPLAQLFEKCDLKIMFLILLVLSSALGVVYTKYLNRNLHIQLEALQNSRDNLHVEWTQLLLEQGTLASDLRVEKIAREKLGMIVPLNKEIVVIQP
ncbi:MAG TPA: cell division protein FtsL [Gammaproteobacteria bacterium]|nr:cell division protein FtsL [Gammaproteobacteria bacterium]